MPDIIPQFCKPNLIVHGETPLSLGKMVQATGHYERALALARKIGARSVEAMRGWNLGLCYEQSDPARAIELMSVQVAYECETGHADTEEHAARVEEIRARLDQPRRHRWPFGRERR